LQAVARFHRTILRNPWLPHRPHPKQALFLLHDDVREIMYGGAGGGGKTDALLMGALQYVDVPGYAALILMPTYADLCLPKAGISRAREWLTGTRARPVDGGKEWRFPSGATLTFGYLADEGEEQRYRTAEFQYVAFDELTRFKESAYRFLFSRLRRLAGADVPIRMRSATNPGGKHGAWVKARFVPIDYHRADPEGRFERVWWNGRRLFVPARLEDNPSLDADDYEESLRELEPLNYAQIRKGDWQAHADGRFRREWFRRYRREIDVFHLDDGSFVLQKHLSRVEICDPANRKTKASKYTAVGMFGDAGQQRLLVLEIDRRKLDLHDVVPAMDALCARWQPVDWCGVEANGFQIGLVTEARSGSYRHIPTVHELDHEGKGKLTRATPAILRAQNGLIYVPEEAEWLEDFLSEVCSFTGDEKLDSYTDQTDILAYSVLGLDQIGSGPGAPPMVLGSRGF
jgi:phage terminase large subunit-like protein